MDNILSKFKIQGYRMTPIRFNIISIFYVKKGIYSADKILYLLNKKNITANKTTIYRELYFLLDKNFITEVNIGKLKKSKLYEYSNEYFHHHHLICNECSSIKHIKINEEYLDKEKIRIETVSDFKITNKFIEFFGVCLKCQNKLNN
jgi:Fur family ferric uptake transcriptional regulator